MGIHNPVTPMGVDADGNSAQNAGIRTSEVGFVNQRHNRYLTLADGDTFPSNETYRVTFTQAENVRRYRVRFTSPTIADTPLLKVVEDAANYAQASAWLTDASSSATADVEYILVRTANKTAPPDSRDGWSDWQELSKDPNDLSLTNLYFLGDTNEAYAIWVEAE